MLKQLRTEKGLNQVELAKKAGVTDEYISMLESGQRVNPSLATLKRLAKVLGVPVAKLLE